MSLPAPDSPPAVSSGPVVLVVGEDFDSLLGPLRWLADTGYDVVDPTPEEVEGAAYAASARIVAPKRKDVLKAVFELAGPPIVGAPPDSSADTHEMPGSGDD